MFPETPSNAHCQISPVRSWHVFRWRSQSLERFKRWFVHTPAAPGLPPALPRDRSPSWCQSGRDARAAHQAQARPGCKAELPTDAVDRQAGLNLLRRCYCTVSRPAWLVMTISAIAFLAVRYLQTPQRATSVPRLQNFWIASWFMTVCSPCAIIGRLSKSWSRAEWRAQRCNRLAGSRSIAVHLDDSFGKGVWRFLRQIVPDAARDRSVRVLARELLSVGAGVRMRCAVGITLESDGWHSDHRKLGKLLLQIIKLRLALRKTEPPAVVVNDDGDMIRVGKGRRAAIERGIVKGPLRRRELPDELRKFVPIFLVAGPTAFGSEVELIPPFEFRLRRQWHLAEFLAADQIAAHGHHGLAAFRPERRHDVGRPRAPIAAGDNRLVDLEGIHQGNYVDGDSRRLTVPRRGAGKKARRAIAA